MTFQRSRPDEWAPVPGIEPSERYWRKQVRAVFESYSSVDSVEIVFSGNKSDSRHLKRGERIAPPGVVVILASLNGRSRREFLPLILSKPRN